MRKDDDDDAAWELTLLKPPRRVAVSKDPKGGGFTSETPAAWRF
jgi:hypothetical protein